MCSKVFTAVLFLTVKDRKRHQCPSGARLDRQWNILQKNEGAFYVWVWKGLQKRVSGKRKSQNTAQYCAASR